MYASGTGVTANNHTALKWFRRGANGGSGSAKFGLGFMYLYGHNLTQDYRTALKHLKDAAEQVGSLLSFLSLKSGKLLQTAYGQGLHKTLELTVALFVPSTCL